MFGHCDRRASYLLCTKNKLRYLRCVIPDLLAASTDDEEIIVFDGDSTDGSKEYLNELYRQGRFRVFHSEKDINQAHALNKAILSSRGEIIKVIIDDDVFHYPSIKKCIQLMLDHPQVDALGTNFARASYGERCKIRRDAGAQPAFESWLRANGDPFWFVDQVFMFRRSSLPLVGLWHTGCNCIDVEMTLRLTALRQARLAWFTGTSAVHLLNEGSLGLDPEYGSKVRSDAVRLYRFYGVEIPEEFRPQRGRRHLSKRVRKTLRSNLSRALSALRRVQNRIGGRERITDIEAPEPGKPRITYEAAYEACRTWLHENHQLESAYLITN